MVRGNYDKLTVKLETKTRNLGEMSGTQEVTFF